MKQINYYHPSIRVNPRLELFSSSRFTSAILSLEASRDYDPHVGYHNEHKPPTVGEGGGGGR